MRGAESDRGPRSVLVCDGGNALFRGNNTEALMFCISAAGTRVASILVTWRVLRAIMCAAVFVSLQARCEPNSCRVWRVLRAIVCAAVCVCPRSLARVFRGHGRKRALALASASS